LAQRQPIKESGVKATGRRSKR